LKIIVDADACPVKDEIESFAKANSMEVIMVIDTSHILTSDYSKIIVVDKGKDNVDMVVINNTCKGDIVVTQDFGVACLALGKGAHAINQNGLIFTDKNMDKFLFERHLSKQARKMGKKTTHVKKRTKIDDKKFEKSLQLLSKHIK